MSAQPPNEPPRRDLSSEVKNFFSAGSSFSIIGCAGAVRIIWAVLERIWPPFKSDLTGLGLAALIVFAYALLIPEPRGTAYEGQLKLTLAEIIFGILNTPIVFAVALGLQTVLG